MSRAAGKYERDVVQVLLFLFVSLGTAVMNVFIDTFFYVATGSAIERLWATGVAAVFFFLFAGLIIRFFGIRIYRHDVAEKKFMETTTRLHQTVGSFDHSRAADELHPILSSAV